MIAAKREECFFRMAGGKGEDCGGTSWYHRIERLHDFERIQVRQIEGGAAIVGERQALRPDLADQSLLVTGELSG